MKTKSHQGKMSVDRKGLDEKKDPSAHRLPVMRVSLYNRPLRTFGPILAIFLKTSHGDPKQKWCEIRAP
jgi:hypothetical protein